MASVSDEPTTAGTQDHAKPKGNRRRPKKKAVTQPPPPSGQQGERTKTKGGRPNSSGGGRSRSPKPKNHRGGGGRGGRSRSPIPNHGAGGRQSNGGGRSRSPKPNHGGGGRKSSGGGRSRSPKPNQGGGRKPSGGSRSKSPKPNHGRPPNGSRSKSPKPGHGKRRSPKKNQTAADMTIILNRIHLWDDIKKLAEIEEEDAQEAQQQPRQHPDYDVTPYRFEPDMTMWIPSDEATPLAPVDQLIVQSVRAPHDPDVGRQKAVIEEGAFDVNDTSFPNPHPPSVVEDKYWCQRRRFFSRFDMGVQLDSEGWYSVSPEVIADQVAERVGDFSESSAFRQSVREPGGVVVLDAFCGCGGNAIAFGKQPSSRISLVICADIDRSKLRMAAYNAALYDIPTDKIVFVECNSVFILGHCYKDGKLVLGTGKPIPNMPPPVRNEIYAGFKIGGVDLLPPRVDVLFLDPPWGGTEYNKKKNRFDLEKDMLIPAGPWLSLEAPSNEPEPDAGGLDDDFFDTFGSKSSPQPKNGASIDYLTGFDLVEMAACATGSRFVVYKLPRNINKISLGRAALAAGYRGNIKLEDHYLNDRLKDATAYMGENFVSLLD